MADQRSSSGKEGTVTYNLRQPALLPSIVLLLLGLLIGMTLVDAVRAQQPNPTPGPSQPVLEQNLDGHGWIKIHEQGVANANVTGGSLSVNNFPPTQNVSVTGGQVVAQTSPVTVGFSQPLSVDAGMADIFTLPAVINATTVSIGKPRAEAAIYFLSSIPVSGSGWSSLWGASVFSIQDYDGDVPFVNHSFTRPVPIRAVAVHCANESDTCSLLVDIVGDPGI
jgi:hypothetical protein